MLGQTKQNVLGISINFMISMNNNVKTDDVSKIVVPQTGSQNMEVGN